MRRTALRILIALTLAGVGWSVGRAQTTIADIEFTVDAPSGRTTLTCLRGCAWGPSGNNTTAFGCGAPRCLGTFNGRGMFLTHNNERQQR
jgi:hypothetical protein